ncbi:unnamed protein product [Rhizophagus irregularis]|nr:unnamed protein product [Rhizophagus irregularis]
MDNFILEKKLKWIPYDKFKNIEYLDKGGFGTIYKANWLINNEDKEVVLKCHDNLSENLNEFLNEWKYHKSCLGSDKIIYFYGFTKAPNTLKYMMSCYTSRLHGFTSKQLNEILGSRDLQAYYSSQSTSGKVNEILESEDSQASVKVDEMLLSENLDDCIFNLKSLDIKTDKK